MHGALRRRRCGWGKMAHHPLPAPPCPPTATAHRPPRSLADMAGTSLLALLDDIAAILDDVALMSKVAATKTAGVLGDDLALNAQQLAGLRAERELPVVWAVAVGSLKNKAVLVPAALAISAWAPWAITPLLMAGGAYLCYEGVEKLAHPLLHGGANAHPAPAADHGTAPPSTTAITAGSAAALAASSAPPPSTNAITAGTAAAPAAAGAVPPSTTAVTAGTGAVGGSADPAQAERDKIKEIG